MKDKCLKHNLKLEISMVGPSSFPNKYGQRYSFFLVCPKGARCFEVQITPIINEDEFMVGKWRNPKNYKLYEE